MPTSNDQAFSDEEILPFEKRFILSIANMDKHHGKINANGNDEVIFSLIAKDYDGRPLILESGQEFILDMWEGTADKDYWHNERWGSKFQPVANVPGKYTATFTTTAPHKYRFAASYKSSRSSEVVSGYVYITASAENNPVDISKSSAQALDRMSNDPDYGATTIEVYLRDKWGNGVWGHQKHVGILSDPPGLLKLIARKKDPARIGVYGFDVKWNAVPDAKLMILPLKVTLDGKATEIINEKEGYGDPEILIWPDTPNAWGSTMKLDVKGAPALGPNGSLRVPFTATLGAAFLAPPDNIPANINPVRDDISKKLQFLQNGALATLVEPVAVVCSAYDDSKPETKYCNVYKGIFEVKSVGVQKFGVRYLRAPKVVHDVPDLAELHVLGTKDVDINNSKILAELHKFHLGKVIDLHITIRNTDDVELLHKTIAISVSLDGKVATTPDDYELMEDAGGVYDHKFKPKKAGTFSISATVKPDNVTIMSPEPIVVLP